MNNILSLDQFDSHIINIKGITDHNKKIKKGYLFAAIPGMRVDGSIFIPQAIERGAKFILCTKNIAKKYANAYSKILFFTTQNVRRSLALCAYKVYQPVPRHMVVVTGTNGKTSTVEFTRQLWYYMGIESASIGTLGTITKTGFPLHGKLTTPDAPAFFKRLHWLAKLKKHYVALEASSQGLDLFRIDGPKYTAGAFLNLTREHLDYHKSMDNYRASKLRLFREILPEKSTVVCNCEDSTYKEIENIARERNLNLISFGLHNGALHYVKYAKNGHKGYKVEFDCLGTRYHTTVKINAKFQLSNILCAIGLVMSTGFSPNEILPHIHKLKSIKGRLECVAKFNNRSVYLDYAHTPDGLQKVLMSTKEIIHPNGRIILVFGAAGERDTTKRPIMGQIASQYADIVIITDDNPRKEDPKQIRTSVLSGSSNNALEDIHGRHHAIEWGVSLLKEHDILLITGKGHEQIQSIGDKTIRFQEDKIIAHAIEKYFPNRK